MKHLPKDNKNNNNNNQIPMQIVELPKKIQLHDETKRISLTIKLTKLTDKPHLMSFCLMAFVNCMYSEQIAGTYTA